MHSIKFPMTLLSVRPNQDKPTQNDKQIRVKCLSINKHKCRLYAKQKFVAKQVNLKISSNFFGVFRVWIKAGKVWQVAKLERKSRWLFNVQKSSICMTLLDMIWLYITWNDIDNQIITIAKTWPKNSVRLNQLISPPKSLG